MRQPKLVITTFILTIQVQKAFEKRNKKKIEAHKFKRRGLSLY